MIKSYKIRLYPTEEQEALLWKHVNASRYIWNWALAKQMELFEKGEKFLSGYSMKKEVTKLKAEQPFLREVSAQTLAVAILDLDEAYKKFFTIQKQGKKFGDKTKIRVPYNMLGHPKFKKHNLAKKSFYTRYDALYLTEDTVNIEKIGKVKYKTDLQLPIVGKRRENKTKFINPRVKYENDKWILSFGIEQKFETLETFEMPELKDFSLGIDLGTKTLATVSNGDKYSNPNKTKSYRKLYKQLEQKQRKYSKQAKKAKSGKNQAKTLKRVKKLHSKIANKRIDYIHKMTHKIVSLLPRAIAVEDLNVKGMMKNKKLAKHIGRACFHEILRQLEYKCKHRGIRFIKADRFFPSSKKCSNCGNIKHDLKLKDRVYNCGTCGSVLDRDVNAAVNLEILA